MVTAQVQDGAELQQTRVLLEVVKAFAVCSDAMTREGVDSPKRLSMLMEAHSSLMAACGPGHSIAFSDLLDRLSVPQDESESGSTALFGRLDGLLPPWVDAEALRGVPLMSESGVPTADAFDFRFEAQLVLRAAQKVGKLHGPVTLAALDSEYSQESVFSSIKGPFYVNHRTNLVKHPVVTDAEKKKLHLPVRANSFYEPIAQSAQYRGWWFPCPACRWPMQVSVSRPASRAQVSVRCLYPWHADTGACYSFGATTGSRAPVLHPDFECRLPEGRFARLWTGATPDPVEPLPVEGYQALKRPVWRYTTIAGLPELRLHEELVLGLEGTEFMAELWPGGDRYDHDVTRAGSSESLYPADLKDYTWVNHLITKIHMDGGDRGGARWLIVPDHRKSQVQQLNAVGRAYKLQALIATDYLEMVLSAAKKEALA